MKNFKFKLAGNIRSQICHGRLIFNVIKRLFMTTKRSSEKISESHAGWTLKRLKDESVVFFSKTYFPITESLSDSSFVRGESKLS